MAIWFKIDKARLECGKGTTNLTLKLIGSPDAPDNWIKADVPNAVALKAEIRNAAQSGDRAEALLDARDNELVVTKIRVS